MVGENLARAPQTLANSPPQINVRDLLLNVAWSLRQPHQPRTVDTSSNDITSPRAIVSVTNCTPEQSATAISNVDFTVTPVNSEFAQLQEVTNVKIEPDIKQEPITPSANSDAFALSDTLSDTATESLLSNCDSEKTECVSSSQRSPSRPARTSACSDGVPSSAAAPTTASTSTASTTINDAHSSAAVPTTASTSTATTNNNDSSPATATVSAPNSGLPVAVVYELADDLHLPDETLTEIADLANDGKMSLEEILQYNPKFDEGTQRVIRAAGAEPRFFLDYLFCMAVTSSQHFLTASSMVCFLEVKSSDPTVADRKLCSYIRTSYKSRSDMKNSIEKAKDPDEDQRWYAKRAAQQFFMLKRNEEDTYRNVLPYVICNLIFIPFIV